MSSVIEVNTDNFEEEIVQSKKPVLADFWAEWCGPCKMIAPIVETIAEDYKDKLKVCKIDVDSNSELASRYGVRGIPTLIIFKEGEVEDTKVGGLSKSHLEEFIKQHL